MSPDLPPALRQAADRLLEGVSRKGLAEQSARISAQYRAGQSSAGVVGSTAEATAYVLTRLPATYAAGAHVLAEAARIAPDFQPRTLLDAGAGPGGAGWAALETWPALEAATLLDSNQSFLEMATTLAAEGPAALRDAQRLRGDLTAPRDWPAVDLAIASYALAEIAPARQAETVAALWAATLGMLVLIEPGTPAGHARILAARDGLIAAGATILAPCPHHAACPLVAPDWCHFVQRLPRSRDHRLAKGGEVPFEDEKFSYLVAARAGGVRREARILAPPHAAKPGITFKLCTPEGTAEPRFVPRREKRAYAIARRLDWGDVLPGTE
ncbi:small ribosomal subunit Rsm22 family protein [Phenylobacterium sp. LH3H17]|uniref:small ribosomal subunit Rsm22 family protein n=1 Tax=Phenylobacterium sp. LH3H17 TaxID=2903901 RepID=UPI0020C9C9F3|nr:small ribosomal subunit Rsm22 family protein [Phenylobacterium sp. LH3H17]UTP39578.1 small ribosomal subunit Rsm22 family protein [Phenylobacterium sp. LH3H17]